MFLDVTESAAHITLLYYVACIDYAIQECFSLANSSLFAVNPRVHNFFTASAKELVTYTNFMHESSGLPALMLNICL